MIVSPVLRWIIRSGSAADPDGDENANLIVHAYNAASGGLRWENIRADGSAASALDAFGGQVFGSGVEPGPWCVVRVYEAATGDLLRSDTMENDWGFNFDTAVDREPLRAAQTPPLSNENGFAIFMFYGRIPKSGFLRC